MYENKSWKHWKIFVNTDQRGKHSIRTLAIFHIFIQENVAFSFEDTDGENTLTVSFRILPVSSEIYLSFIKFLKD